MKDKDSPKKRFIYTFIVNAIKMFAAIISSTMVPVSLGATNYGNFNFASSILLNIKGFTSLGTTGAFFTFNSKNKNSSNSSIIYFSWSLIQYIFIIGFIIAVYFFDINEKIFPGQEKVFIYIMSGLMFVGVLSSDLISFGESKAKNVIVQKISLAGTLFSLILISVFYFLKDLNLYSYILINYISYVFISVLVSLYFLKKERFNQYFQKVSSIELKKVFSYFIVFCKPLILYEVFGLVFNMFDRWILQYTSGSIEQAYFSISFKWTSVVLLFTTSLLNVFWRDLSVSYQNNDIERSRLIFYKSYRFVFFISSVLAIFIFFNASNLVNLLLNKEYISAIPVIRMMVFYTIFYAVNQLNTTVFYATEKTKLYKNIAVVSMITGIILSYFLIAPSSYLIPGLGLSSIGIAIKMLLLSVVFGFVFLYFVSKELKFSFVSFLIKQILFFSLIFSPGFFLNLAISFLQFSYLLNIILFILFYFVFIIIIVIKRPDILGLTKKDISNILSVISILKK